LRLEPHRTAMTTALDLHSRLLRTRGNAGKKKAIQRAAAMRMDPPRLANC
jgi:hypothetical protein